MGGRCRFRSSWRRLVYAGHEPEEWRTYRDDVTRINMIFLRRTALFFGGAGMLVLLLDLLTDLMHGTVLTLLMFSLVMLLVYIVAHRYLPEHPRAVWPLYIIFLMAVFTVTFDLGLIQSSYPSILFFILLVTLSVIFTENMYVVSAIDIICTVAFCIGSFYLHSHDVFLMDLVHAICFVPLAWFLAWHSDKVKLWSIIMRRQAEEQRDVDSLTHLASRHRFDELVDMLHGDPHARRIAAAFMVDIDRFKTYNDTYGHLAGDEVLRSVSSVCRENMRETDIVGRFGGEEFAVLLPGADLEDVRGVAERIRACVQELEVVYLSYIIHVTVCIGVASVSRPGAHDVYSLIFQADRALYSAKNSGRNHVYQ